MLLLGFDSVSRVSGHGNHEIKTEQNAKRIMEIFISKIQFNIL